MEIKEIYGDVLESHAEIIAHSCNIRGEFNSGLAKTIGDKFPEVKGKYQNACTSGYVELGGIQVVNVGTDYDKRYIVNMFTQEELGYENKRYVSYDALDTCLKKLSAFCEKEYIRTIAIPWHLSCGRGGGEWDVVMTLIKSAFRDTFITIEICKL